MLKKIIFLSLVLLLAFKHSCFAQTRQIAITMDDLPFIGEAKNFHLKMILETLKDNEIPFTGFIIANTINPDNWQMLHQFRDSGFGLGNHSFSHINLSKVDTEGYIQEIEKADKILSRVLTEPKYFRYPYLNMGTGAKREAILAYLHAKHYRIAPITIDSKDFLFNKELYSVPQEERPAFLEELKFRYLDYIWEETLKAEEQNRYKRNPEQAQILLIHANLLNAYVLPDIIELYRQHGFSFVSLEDALKTFHSPKKLARKPGPKKPKARDTKIEEFMAWD